MSGLEYVGVDVTAAEDIIYKRYLDTLKESDPTDEHIDSVVATELSPYATRAYVDTKDALLATRSYIDAQDNLRLKLAQKNQANGIAGLGATGRIDPARIDSPLEQSWIRGPWSPTAYHSSEVTTSGTTESTLYTCGVTDPGYPYKLVVFGSQEVLTDIEGTYPIVRVRQGSDTGPIVAQGQGFGEFYGGRTDLFERTSTTGLGDDWTQTQVSGGLAGRIATADGHNASMIVDGWSTVYINARQTGLAGSFITGDYLKVTFTISSTSNTQPLDIIGRWGADNNDYVMFRFSSNNVRVIYVTGGGSQVVLNSSTPACTLQAGSTYDCYWGVTPSTLRRFQVYKNSSLVYDQTDAGGVTTVGSSTRGWGFGMQSNGLGASPCSVGEIRMVDPLATEFPASEAVIMPVDIGSLSTLTGATTLYVRLLGSAVGVNIKGTTFKPKLYVQAIPV